MNDERCGNSRVNSWRLNSFICVIVTKSKTFVHVYIYIFIILTCQIINAFTLIEKFEVLSILFHFNFKKNWKLIYIFILWRYSANLILNTWFQIDERDKYLLSDRTQNYHLLNPETNTHNVLLEYPRIPFLRLCLKEINS